MSYDLGRSSLNNSTYVKRLCNGILRHSSRAAEVNTDRCQQGQLISRLKSEAGNSRVSFLDIREFSIRVLAAWLLHDRRLEVKK